MNQQIELYADNTNTLSKDKKLSLLVLVLLELTFGNNNELFNNIINYLTKTNLIDPDIQSIEYLGSRTKLFNMILHLNSSLPINNELQLQNNNQLIQLINTYNKTFIELNELGYGSFASVYKVQHKIDTKMYAIKKIIITKDLIDLGYDVFDEVKMLANLSHNNIVRYFSSWVDFDFNSILKQKTITDTFLSTNSDYSDYSDYSDNSEHSGSLTRTYPVLFIQTELCDFTLKDYIDNKIENETVEMRLLYWNQIVEGVKYIHLQNIIHRDIKPSNIFFLNGQIKIGDFGLSKKLSSFALQISKSVEIGCDYYRAPEIDTGNYDQTIDIYAVGIILYEMLLNCKTTFERIKTIELFIKNKTIQDNILTNEYNEHILNLCSIDPSERVL
jgi:serine/threonine protein kinase